MKEKEFENYYFCKDTSCSKNEQCKRYIKHYDIKDPDKFFLIRREHNHECFEELDK